jgi:fluoroacetyl-CoA thioesterase
MSETSGGLRPGLAAEVHMTVSEAMSAAQLGSGSVHVLGTPAMVQLMEMATVAAVDPHLPAGQVSVGVGVDVSHLAATPLGMVVRALAHVMDVDEKRVALRVEAYDEVEQIGEGIIQRVIVDRQRFAERVARKLSTGKIPAEE